MCGGFPLAPKFAIGDKINPSFSNHAEGMIVAIFTAGTGDRQYAVELFGYHTIQIASEGSLVAHVIPV